MISELSYSSAVSYHGNKPSAAAASYPWLSIFSYPTDCQLSLGMSDIHVLGVGLCDGQPQHEINFKERARSTAWCA